jgi:TonB-dependent starch-binding outer membrane protein SusC
MRKENTMTGMRSGYRLLLGGLVAAIAAGCGHAASGPPMGPNPERVQTGYGEMRAEDVTGSVSSLQEKDMGSRYSTLGEMLEGRVPGLVVLRQAGGGISLRIRGASSFMGSSDPLIVVDGTALNPFGGSRVLSSINPRDVARIDVLKGSEASIYGSRGANGVVVITTRRP